MHPKNLSDEELLGVVLNNARCSELEKVLASRLALALDYIESVENFLEEHNLIEQHQEWMQ